MSFLSLLKLPSRIAAILAGFGVVGGIFSSGHAALAFRAVPEHYEDVDALVMESGPTLLFSDSPEVVYENGIVYKDILEGESRVFFHHVNGMKGARKLSVLIRPVDRQATITWGCRGIGEPDKAYYISALKGQRRYFTEYRNYWQKARKNKLKKSRKSGKKAQAAVAGAPDYCFYETVPDLPMTKLARGECLEALSQEPDMKRAGIRLKPEQLLTGMFDFYADHPVEVVVMMSDPDEDVKRFSRVGKTLPMDEHSLRGTYPKADLTYVVKNPIQLRWFQHKALCLAGSDDQHFLRGIDGLTGTETQNYGNYGVVYHVKYSVAGERPIQLGINPWGGEFYGAAMQISEAQVNIPASVSL